MSEFRQNIATKEWVVIAPERAKRPEDLVKKTEEKKELPDRVDKCPFCIGNESMTPTPNFTVSNNGQWRTRVVPNKFSALQPVLSPNRKKTGEFLKAEGYGIAEVVIETPKHNKSIAAMEIDEVIDVVITYKNRYMEISKNEKIDLITIFRNHGVKAGTSLEHPHSQIIATPITPPNIRQQVSQARLSYDTFGTCIYCDMIKEEIAQKDRVVIESEYFLVYEPFASRSPFETRIIPKRHKSSFGNISDEEIENFSRVLRIILRKIYKGLNDPDYNYIIRSAPVEESNVKYYHWYVVIIPKITIPAGFEIGTGIFINVIPPENCTKYLKEVKE
ncbi:MAG: galactose-1-phosphate uridylyltransferase [Nitrospirota bacterium]